MRRETDRMTWSEQVTKVIACLLILLMTERLRCVCCRGWQAFEWRRMSAKAWRSFVAIGREIHHATVE